MLMRQDDKVFFESSIIAADSGFLRMFTFTLLRGDASTALNSPHSIILSEKLATKYFGKSNPMGKTITLENRYQFMVTGVVKTLPKNSLFTFEAVIPLSFLQEIGAFFDSWDSNSIFTYVQIEGGSDIKDVNRKLTDIVVEHVPQITTKYLLFHLLDIHLHQQFGFKETKGPVIIVYNFTLIAVFVLLIACINFINLSTAKASSRGKEIGIKKVAGISQITLIVQFMLESLLLVTIAMVLALILVGLSLGLFKSQVRLTRLLKYFTILAAIIACLGLYGLSAYTAERRTNELGIRKVMGAGSLRVMYTLSKEFLVLVLISIAIAVPMGWIIVGNLLREYAYRIELSESVVALISLGAFIIALLTVSIQAYKAAGVNPAEALKVE